MSKFLLNEVKVVLSKLDSFSVSLVCGVKHIRPPASFDDIEFPPKDKWVLKPKVPTYLANVRPPKMMKNLKFMRGPELVNNTLLHKQYGILALSAGRMRYGHFEMARLGIIRKVDRSRMFAIWRIDAPWQPVTKKGQGQRMGGGKGAIDHYVTPIKAGRIIMEIGGHCEFEEVFPALKLVAHNLPFKAIPVTQQMMEEKEAEMKKYEEENINPYTFKYVIQNNLGGCHRWIKPIDKIYFGKYL